MERRSADNGKIDWSECPLVEIKPRVQSGAPVLRGTRMPAGAIIDNYDYGMSVADIAEQFQISTDLIEVVLAYAGSHRGDFKELLSAFNEHRVKYLTVGGYASKL
ncbi:MAG: DUF433 domain-containing protein [Acidobacteriaceae bacterium]|nr:DUF433 domain-containing protein [Acidobacteriaceae bacterium]